LNNRLIPRYEATARLDQEIEIEITGKLDKPLLALHSYVDEFVPVETTRYYMDLTNQQGRTKNFIQCYANSSGHCFFMPSALLHGALKLLDKWIRQGARPHAGDLETAIALSH